MATSNPDVQSNTTEKAQPTYKLIEPQAAANGDMQYNLPINSADVVRVELVDLDLVIVGPNGTGYVLPQGALQSTINPDKAVAKFKNGSVAQLADQYKKAGVVKPVEGGSYRIEATSIKPVPGVSDKLGFDFTIGKEGDDIKAQEQLQQLNNTVQALSQSMQAATLSNAEGNPGLGSGKGAGLGEGAGKTTTTSAVSSTPGAPPNDNTSKKVGDFTQNAVLTKLLKVDPQLFSAADSKTTNLQSASTLDLGNNTVRNFLAEKPMPVKLTSGNVSSDLKATGNDTVANDLLIQGSLNAVKVKFSLVGNLSDLPPGFKLNGQALTSSAIVLDADGTNVQRFNLTWTARADGETVNTSSFQIKVEYVDNAGLSLSTSSLVFNYGDFRTLADTATVNQLYLSARGMSYDIQGNEQANTLHAGYGNDIVRGFDGSDKLFGDQGDDTLIGGLGADTLDGGTGNNTASYADSPEAVFVYLDGSNANAGGTAAGDSFVKGSIQNLIGSDNSDYLQGDANANKLFGGAGDDTLQGGAGADTLDGAAPGASTNTTDVNNTLSYSTSLLGVNINLATGKVSGGDAQGDVISHFRNVIGSEKNDTLTGDDYANQLDGGGGADSLSGGAGNDTLNGGTGNDTLVGGAGADKLIGGTSSSGEMNFASYENASRAVNIDMTLNTQVGKDNQGDENGDVFSNIQGVIGSAFDDVIKGNAAVNALSGGAGNDTLIGGAGADTLDGGEDTDTASYADSTSGVTVTLAEGAVDGKGTGGFAQDDVLRNIENLIGSDGTDSLTGNSSDNQVEGGKGNDTLRGMDGNDKLLGGDGNDSLDGGIGADALDGGAGDDTLIGGAGNDTLDGGTGTGNNTVSYGYFSLPTGTAGTRGVTVDLSNGTANASVAGDSDTLINIQNVIGSSLDDWLKGDELANLLDGGDGNDTLVSGDKAGNDTVKGGNGSDTLVWTATADTNLSMASVFGGENGDKYQSIEVLDLAADGVGSQIEISAAGIRALADQGNESTLTLRVNNIDSYTFATENNVKVSFDKGTSTYTFTDTSGTTSPAPTIAKLILEVVNTQILDQTAHQEESIRVMQHPTDFKVSGVQLLDAANKENNAQLGTLRIDALLPSKPLVVNVVANNTVAPSNDSKVYVDLMLPGLASASKFKLILLTSSTPNGFTIGGKPSDGANTTYEAKAFGVDSVRVPLSWNAAPDGQDVRYLSFTYKVEFYNGMGQLISSSSKLAQTLTFYYDDLRTLADVQAIGNDSNNNAKIYLPARGLSYDIQGQDNPTTGDKINAGAGHDILRGFAGDDTLNGGAGDDTLIGGEGNDSLDGGTGNNTASYDYVSGSNGVTVDLSAGTATVGSNGDRDTLRNIQNVIGSKNNDVLKGDAHANILVGGKGDDTLVGGDGADTLYGGAQTDGVDASDGSDTASYETASSRSVDNQTIFNSGVVASLENPDINEGDAAGDKYVSIENLTGSRFDDQLTGDSGKNILIGGAGSDTLVGGAGADTLYGATPDASSSDTDNNNYASYENASTGVHASLAHVITSGQDSFNTGDAQGDEYHNIWNLYGSTHEDYLQGDDNNNILKGDAGDDTLEGGKGADTLDGGEGTNTVSYEHAVITGNKTLVVNLGSPADNLDTTTNNTEDALGDRYTNINNIIGSNFADKLIGNDKNNSIFGGDGDDTLMGGGGGNDTFNGGNGADTVSYEKYTTGVKAYLDSSSQGGNAGSAAGHKYISIENLTGTSQNDTLAGDANDNSLSGAVGDDYFFASLGKDTFDGGIGTDTVSYETFTDAINVNLQQSKGSVSDSKTDTYIGIEKIKGGTGSDTLTGDSNNNVLWGGAGNDTLDGGGGTDSLFGEDGNDVFKNSGGGTHYYDGGSGTNTVTYEGFTTSLTLSLKPSDASNNGAGGTEVFVNIQNLIGGNTDDVLKGDDYNNQLTGNDGKDSLYGYVGNDLLSGGKGDDFLDGGAGEDTLNGGDGNDTVSYANSGPITLDLFNTRSGAGEAQGDVLSSIETLVGSAYDDTFVAGLGGDTEVIARYYQGGGGTDTVDFSHSSGTDGVVVSLATNSMATGGYAQGATFDSIENLIGSNNADKLTGNSSANVLQGGSGNDTFYGSTGGNGDTFYGGTKSGTNNTDKDTADYSSFGTSSALTVDMSSKSGVGGGGAYTVVIGGSAQQDKLYDIINLSGSQGNDNIKGDAADNSIWGNEGNDILKGDAGADTLYGGAGDDTLIGGVGADSLVGGDGVNTASYEGSADSVRASLANFGSNTNDAAGDHYVGIQNLLGSGKDDTLEGDANDNSLSGGDGNDLLVSSAGADSFSGGNGTDTVDYSGISTALTIAVFTGTNKSTSTAGSQAFGDVIGQDIEIIKGANADTTFLAGNRSYITTYAGTAGKVNTVSYANVTDGGGVQADLRNTQNSSNMNLGAAVNDRYTNIANLTGSKQNDTLSGNEFNNSVSGGLGDDLIFASLGVDSLDGGEPSDTDTVSFANMGFGVNIILNLGSAQQIGSSPANTVLLTGFENLTGTSLADTLTGDSDNNYIDGGGGNDKLFGGGGDDTLFGGAGADSFSGGDGIDTVTYKDVTVGDSGKLTIDLSFDNLSSVRSQGTGDAAGDVIGSDIEKVIGSQTLSNVFYGRSGDEDLTGGDANDTFYGSLGSDKFDGGQGINTADYSGAGTGIQFSGSTGSINGGTSTSTTDLSKGDTLTNIQKIVGTAQADKLDLTAYASAMTFVARDGADTYMGGSAADTIDLINGRTTSLAGVSIQGGGADDTIMVDQAKLSGTFVLSGDGTSNNAGSNDTLQFYATNSGSLDLRSIFASGNEAKYQYFETLDLSKDGVASDIKISADCVRALVDNGNASTLTIKINQGDNIEFLNDPLSGSAGSIRVTEATESGKTYKYFIDSSNSSTTYAKVYIENVS